MIKEEQNYQPSLLQGFTTKQSQALSWLMVINHITGGALCELTQRYRDTGDWQWKSRLLCITPACQLNGTGKEASDIVGLTGVAMADFDHIDPARMDEVRTQVNADPHTFLSYVTVSGCGLRVLYRYEGMDYAAAFLTGNCYYADLIGHPFDEKCSNANRLSALCHDAQAYLNEKAMAFKDSTASADVTAPVAYAVRTVECHGENYYHGNRHTYLMKCVCMMNRLGVSQQEAEQWALAFDLGEREIRTLVKSVYGLYAAQHGTYDMPRRHLASCNTLPKPHTHARETLMPLTAMSGAYRWPERLQRMIDCGETVAQRDVILLSSILVIGALTSRLLRIPYAHKSFWPCLQLFVVAPPASGKGCISWVRRLAEPLHKSLMAQWQQKMAIYRKAKAAYDQAGNRRAEMDCPEEPRMKMFLVAGNNSGTGIQENVMDAEGQALICEVEADTVSTATNAEYGGWSDMLRKAFEHERLAYNRRAGHEYREIDTLRLSVLLSGTPAQVKPLIPSAENGLYSRQLFYVMPAVGEWIDQFGDETQDYDNLFMRWGEEWGQVQKELESRISQIVFHLTQEQRIEFNHRMSQLFAHAVGTHKEQDVPSSVKRLAVNILRMMSVVALLRALEEEKGLTPSDSIPVENIQDGIVPLYQLAINDADYHAVLDLSEPLYRHAMSVLQLLPSCEAERRQLTPIEQLLEGLPMRFTRQQVLQQAEALGIKEGTLDSQLSRMAQSGQLIKPEKGVYEFASPSRARVHNN